MTVIQAVTSMLEYYLAEADRAAIAPTNSSPFHALSPTTISVADYLQRMLKYMYCSDECYVLALIYLDRIHERVTWLEVNSRSIHRLFLTGVVVAAKFFEDKYYKNSYYCKVGGITNRELNNLEYNFLRYLDFSLYVSHEDYERYFNTLMTFAQTS